MSIQVDTLNTRYTLDARDYNAKAKQATGSTKALAVAQTQINRTSQSMVRSVGSAGDAFSMLGRAMTVAGVAIAAVAAPLAMLKGPIEAAGKFEALTLSLESVEGSSKKAAIALRDLRDIASGPGLGVEESIRGYTQLRNAGLGGGISRRLIRELGNANARAGGGPEELKNILRQISQAASKPFLQGEELSTLTENGIPAYRIVRDALGTADTEELKRRGVTSVQVLYAITEALEQTERVAGGTRNAFDNLQDSIAQATVSFGAALNQSVGPLATKLGDIINIANKGGVFSDFGRSIADALSLDGTDIEDMFVNVAAAIKTAVTLAGNLKTAIINALGPIARFIYDHSPQAQLINAMSGGPAIFEGERNALRMQMELGRKRQRQETEQARLAKEAGIELDDSDSSISSEIAKNTKETAEQTRRIAETVINQQSLGGGAFAKDAINAVGIDRALNGMTGAQKQIARGVMLITSALDDRIGDALEGERRHGRLSGAF